MRRRLLSGFLAPAVAAVLVVGLAGRTTAEPASNLNARLRGDYALNGTLVCFQNQAGVGPAPGLVALGPGNTRTTNLDGVIRFNGDGTAFLQARSLTIFHNPAASLAGGQPVSESEFSANVLYTVKPDGTFTAELAVSGEVLSGISAGQSLDISNIMRQGRIGQGGQTLLISNTFANVENVEIGGTSLKRICGRSGAAVKID